MSPQARAVTIDRLLDAVAAVDAAQTILVEREPWRDRSELDVSLAALVDRALAGVIEEERRALIRLLRTLERELTGRGAGRRPRDAMPAGRRRPALRLPRRA